MECAPTVLIRDVYGWKKRARAQKRSPPLRGKKEKQQNVKETLKKRTMRKRKRQAVTGAEWCAKSAQMNNERHYFKVRQGSLFDGIGICICPVTLSYQLPGQEKILLPCHHHIHTLSLLGAAQHGHQLLLAATRHVYSIHLHTRKREITLRCLLHKL